MSEDKKFNEKIIIVEGFKEDFENQINKLLLDGWDPVVETHRLIEVIGKTYYSCLFIKEIKEAKDVAKKS